MAKLILAMHRSHATSFGRWEEGKITAQGRFEELQHSSSALKSLLQAGAGKNVSCAEREQVPLINIHNICIYKSMNISLHMFI